MDQSIIARTFIDQLGRSVSLPATPVNIVSIVPSQTELLYDLGLRNEVSGITKFCIHPDDWHRSKSLIGGTKNLNLEKIRSLSPDLVIANKEENTEEQVTELEKEFPVWISDIRNIEDAYEMIRSVSLMTGKEIVGKEIIENINGEFQLLRQIDLLKWKSAYLIWNDPMMTIGGDTFISQMMHEAGLENIFAERERYPVTSVEELKELKPEVLILSSEPYPFKEKNAEEFRVKLPGTKVIIVDGEMFSWYGSRLLRAPRYFSDLQGKIQSTL